LVQIQIGKHVHLPKLDETYPSTTKRNMNFPEVTAYAETMFKKSRKESSAPTRRKQNITAQEEFSDT
jgi:hypothetical protein